MKSMRSNPSMIRCTTYRIASPTIGQRTWKPQRQFHHTPRLEAFAPFAWLKSMGRQFRDIYRGDDHINPKKILERKYLYLNLLAIHFRKLRLAAKDPDTTERSKDELFEKAIEELDALGLDKTTNVDLRLLQQSMLIPQVKDIFGTFQQVDERLGIPFHLEQADGRSIMDENEFVEKFRDVLLMDFEKTQQELSKVLPESKNQISFLTTKSDAISILLQYYGWVYNSDSQSVPIVKSEGTLDPFGMKLDDTNADTMHQIRQYQTVNICRSALIRDALGYSVLALRSSIPGAGRGLFLDGSSMAGAIVAFQPGDVWPKEHLLTDAQDVMDHFERDDDFHVSMRFDDYVVDSRQSPVVVLCREGSLNPWALGNTVNHPTSPLIPNCQSTMINYTAKAKFENLIRYVPNSYARIPTWQSTFFDLEEVIMHGLCLVSRKDVHNEELLYDYRLQSDTLPDWYEIVKYDNGLEEDQVVFFRDDWKKD